MKFFFKIFSFLAILTTFAIANTTQAVVNIEPLTTDSSTTFLEEQTSKQAVWIKLEGDVEPTMYDFCARAIGKAIESKPDYIIFEINTFGGRLDAAFDLVDTIMAIQGPTTIALVKKKAISAGSLIALACNKLYMFEATTIGDCAPIVQNSDGTPKIVGEKIQSPLRAKFRNLAQRNGYPELLSSAFVTPELEVIELKKTLDKGKSTERDTTLITESIKYSVFDDSTKAFWGAPKILVKEGELLTMTDQEAYELGFSQGTFKNREAFENALSIVEKSEVETTVGEDIASAISAIAGILLILGFGALYIEFKTPGFGLFGIIGIILISIVFLGQFAPQLDGYFPAVLLLVGVALFVVEIFVMPGTFLFGIGGIICMILALAMSYDPTNIPEYVPEAVETTFDATPWLFGLLFVITSAAIALIFPIALSRYIMPILPEGLTPMLKADLKTAASPTEAILNIKAGDIGVAKTFLRPVGQAEFSMENGNTILIDVHSRGEIIEAGQSIKVESVQEGHVFVKILNQVET